jgi:hypothetical protein
MVQTRRKCNHLTSLIIIVPKKIVTVPILEILNSFPYLLFCTLESLQNHNMSDQKRLFLLDAYALIFRGYYVFKKSRINSKGMDTSAIMGFMN